MTGASQDHEGLLRSSGVVWRKAPKRPPWVSENLVRQRCTSCGDCIRACPENILISGPANTPVVDFNHGGCTFCGACAEACTEDVFFDDRSIAWRNVAGIEGECFLGSGISCQSCTDSCDYDALQFTMGLGGVGSVTVQSEACTGCGACVSVCPANAIEISEKCERSA